MAWLKGILLPIIVNKSYHIVYPNRLHCQAAPSAGGVYIPIK